MKLNGDISNMIMEYLKENCKNYQFISLVLNALILVKDKELLYGIMEMFIKDHGIIIHMMVMEILIILKKINGKEIIIKDNSVKVKEIDMVIVIELSYIAGVYYYNNGRKY